MYKCPVCDTHMEPAGNAWVCVSCGYLSSSSDLPPEENDAPDATSSPDSKPQRWELRKACPECKEQTLTPAGDQIVCTSCGHLIRRPRRD